MILVASPDNPGINNLPRLLELLSHLYLRFRLPPLFFFPLLVLLHVVEAALEQFPRVSADF